MNSREVQKLLKCKEGLKIDFKREYKLVKPIPVTNNSDWNKLISGQWDEFIKDIIALVNGNVGTVDQTAYLIIGADDKLTKKGRITFDVSHLKISAQQILSKINSACDPPIPDLLLETVNIRKNTIYIISIPPSPHIHETTRTLEVVKGDFDSAGILRNIRSEGTYTARTAFIRRGEDIWPATKAERDALEADKTRYWRNGNANRTMLEQNVRDWFNVIGYRFENYAVQGDSYFEFIINIPKRRGFDRVLIRGVDGEAKISDLMAVKDRMKEMILSESWIVANRRISAVMSQALKNGENEGIYGYTFDELLDDQANFDKYILWLEEEVESRHIDRNYVDISCRKDEYGLSVKDKLGTSYYGENNGWIDGYINKWLDDPSKEHISILGEFGTGKTWFALHYAYLAVKKYKYAKEQGVERPRMPLYIPLRDYAKAVSVESLFSEFFFRKHEIPLPGYSVFEQLNRMGKLLLIFDGFDEMASQIDRQKMINNFWELAKVVVPGSKVILTCRTEHFPEAQEGRSLLNAELKASTSALTGASPQFEVLELEMLNVNQIQKMISLYADKKTAQKIIQNPELVDLARRPLMVELILEALPEIREGKKMNLSRVYLYAVSRKIERDIKTERTFTSFSDKLFFLCELSWEMLSSDRMTVNYRLFPDTIRRLFGGQVQEVRELDHWHYDMMGQTMLVRNEHGDYSPAHRSLLEFFVAYKFAAELGILAEDFILPIHHHTENMFYPRTTRTYVRSVDLLA